MTIHHTHLDVVSPVYQLIITQAETDQLTPCLTSDINTHTQVAPLLYSRPRRRLTMKFVRVLNFITDNWVNTKCPWKYGSEKCLNKYRIRL